MHNNFTICELYDKITLGGLMDKGAFLNELYDNIKDKIVFDSDILALYRILEGFIKIDIDEAIKKWQYLLAKYDIPNLRNDIDFSPLTNMFPTTLFQILPLDQFYRILEKTPYNKLIYHKIFNTFDNSSALYQEISRLIASNEEEKERKTIQMIIEKKDYYPESSFDLSTFLKNIILLHLNQKNKNINLLLEYANIPKDLKDKSVLKTLLIDYL